MSQEPLAPALASSEEERENHRQPVGESVAIAMNDVTFGAMKDPDITVAEHVNWTVKTGEFWIVAGPQRSGKTDLLMLAAGLLPPTHGTYHFFGAQMPIFEQERLAERLRLGLVFDSGQLFNHLTLGENVALPLRYHRNLSPAEAEPRVRAMLELTELLPLADQTPGAVAHNWKKRAGLARALILEPEVLLLDNPLAGLDARHAAWWLNFLEQLSAGHSFRGGRPMTLVAATDGLRRWRDRGHQFAVINAGKFSVIGSRDDLARSADPLVKELVTGAVAAPVDVEKLATEEIKNPKS